MATYMIGYDLHEGEDYEDLEQAIKDISEGNWWHCLDSTWLITHPGPATTIRDALKPHLINPNKEGGDRLLVAKLSGEAAWTGSFSDNCKSWLKNTL